MRGALLDGRLDDPAQERRDRCGWRPPPRTRRRRCSWRAWRMAARARSSTSSRVVLSLSLMCRSDVEMNTCSRPRAAGRDRLAGELDVALVAAGQGGDDRPAHLGGDLQHAAVVALRGRREPGLHDVHAERVELPGESELLLGGETVAGSLLAIAQGRVEDQDVGDCHTGTARRKRVKRKAPRTFGSAAPVHSVESSTVSRCSCRHAADPLLTNKDGKQEAKDDDEHEAEQHRVFDGSVRWWPDRWRDGYLHRLTRSRGMSRGDSA